MTRFMMTLDDAVDLVIYAFEHGHNGDLFVQKAPAATFGCTGAGLEGTYAQVDPKYGETGGEDHRHAPRRNCMRHW